MPFVRNNAISPIVPDEAIVRKSNSIKDAAIPDAVALQSHSLDTITHYVCERRMKRAGGLCGSICGADPSAPPRSEWCNGSMQAGGLEVRGSFQARASSPSRMGVSDAVLSPHNAPASQHAHPHPPPPVVRSGAACLLAVPPSLTPPPSPLSSPTCDSLRLERGLKRRAHHHSAPPPA